jgi:hypothetical protein
LPVPVELKHLVEPLQDLLRVVAEGVGVAAGGAAVDYAAIEREIAERTAAIERGAHEMLLARLDVNRARVEIRGDRYVQVGYGNGTYYTLSGPVQVPRALYRKLGVRNAKVVDAISLRTGAVGAGWLPQTAQAMAYLLQQGTSREAEQTAKQLGRLPYSRNSFERVSHELAEQFLPEQADIENELIEELAIPDQTRAVSLALDRTALPMEEPRKRPVGRPRKGAPKRPVSREWRMAYCATLTLHDAEGRALRTIRHACMPNGEADLMSEGMVADVHLLLQRRPDLQVVLLGDGSPENWNLLGCIGVVAHTQVLDFWHLIEKLSAAASLIHGADRAKTLTTHWRLRLRNSSSAARRILAELEASGCEHMQRDGEQPVHQAITYLRNNLHRMDYRAALDRGLPIGSGVAEATCKTLVGLRMKRSGSRWKESTANHILQLRALALSDRFDDALAKLFAQRRTTVRRAA